MIEVNIYSSLHENVEIEMLERAPYSSIKLIKTLDSGARTNG